MSAELIRGNRGSDSRVFTHNGYKYQLNQTRNTGMYWRCSRTHCRASVKTNTINIQDFNALIQVQNVGAHNHGNDDIRGECADVVNEMKVII